MCVATHLTRPTRTATRKRVTCRPYLVLLPVGLAVPPLLPETRCALTAPFQPCRGFRPVGGVISVALSLGSPPPAVNRHRLSVEPGLSSNRSPCPRSPGHLTACLYAGFQASAKSTMAAACNCIVSYSGTVASVWLTSSGISVQPRMIAWQPCATRSAITAR